MELREYFGLLRRWWWLLILGAILVGGGAYYISVRQTPLYQSSAKVMILSSARDPIGSDIGYYYRFQLVQTYSQLMISEPYIEAVGEKVNHQVNAGQISINQIGDTTILRVTVTDTNGYRAADIANMLIDVLIENNEDLQAARFASSEESLQEQIQIIQTQIAELQSAFLEGSEESLDSKLQEVEEQSASLKTQIVELQVEIEEMTFEPESAIRITPTFDPVMAALLKGKRLELDQLQRMLTLYQNLYFNLLLVDVDRASGASSAQSGNDYQLQASLAMYQQIYANLISNYEAVRLARVENTPTVSLVETAKPGLYQISPHPVRSAILGSVVGMMLAAGIVFLIEYLDDTVKSPEELVRVLELPILGYLASMRNSNSKGEEQIFVANHPRSPVSEAFRTLRTNLKYAGAGKPLKSILITSSGAQEGKTTVSANLALVIAQGGKKVVLMDADLRRPRIHKILGMSNRVGLSDYIVQDADLGDISQISAQSENLTVIPSGKIPPNPADLLESERLNELIATLEEQSDLVIIDSPPFLVTDSLILSEKSDGVLLVIQSGLTRLRAAKTGIELLERAGARVVGVALNRITRQHAYYYPTYYSENHYYYGDDDGSSSRSGSRFRRKNKHTSDSSQKVNDRRTHEDQ